MIRQSASAVGLMAPSSLTRQAVRGAAWTLPTRLLSRGVGLVGTLLLARYLAPGEYGEVSATAILAASACSVTTFGVGVYLVANRDLSAEDAFHATCWFMATGAAALLAVVAFQGTLGSWFGIPHISVFLPVLALANLVERVVYVPERMLVRQLRFRWLSLSRAIGELAFTATSLTLAGAGVGPMAIGWGSLARAGVRFAAIVPSVDRREWLQIRRLKGRTMARVIGYGANVAAAGLATYGMRRWDNLLVGRYFGPSVMGAYNYAYNLADTPAVVVGEQLSDVVSASFPHAEPKARAAALIRSCTLMTTLMLPLAFGLGAVAPTLVQTFFDERWAGVGGMLVVLAVLSAPRPVAEIVQAYLYASNRPRVVLWIEWLSLGAIGLAISTVGRLGVMWTCFAVATVFILRALAGVWIVQRQDGTNVARCMAPLAGPFVSSLAMVAGILIVRLFLTSQPGWLRLVIEILTGATIYVGGVLAIARPVAREFLGLVRMCIRRP